MIKNQGGMSLVELVIGLTLSTVIMIAAFGQFTPWLQVRQKFMTEMKMNEMQRSLLAAYHAKSSNIDATNTMGGSDYPEIVPGPTGGLVYFEKNNQMPLQTSCNDLVAQTANQSTLIKILGNADADFSKDAYGQDICVVVTQANVYDTGSIRIYYHTILLISKGKNGNIDTKVNLQTGSFTDRDLLPGEPYVTNDDIIRVVNGYEIQRQKFILARNRLEQTAQAFENYFQIQFLTDTHRDLLKNYFSSNPGQPLLFAPYDISIIETPRNGIMYQSPGRDAGAQQVWQTIFSKIGLSLEDVKNPWISCDNTETQAQCSNDFVIILMDPTGAGAPASIAGQGVHGLVRSPSNPDSWFRLPPYNVIFAMDYPGRLDAALNPGNRFLLKSAQSKY